jgi:hypothetical protein
MWNERHVQNRHASRQKASETVCGRAGVRLNEEKIKQFTTREIFAYFKIIDKVDSRADVRQWWNARSE